MSPPPVIAPVSTEIYDALGPWTEADPVHSYQLMLYVDAHGIQLQPLEDLVRVSNAGVGWTLLLDIARIPDGYLDHLAQWIGVETNATQTAAQKRTAIQTVSGWNRGTPASVVGAVQGVLTGTKRVDMTERDGGDAYALRILTYTAETPTPGLVLPALLTVKPGGITYTIICQSGPRWEQINPAETWAAITPGLTWAAIGGLIPPNL